MMLILLISGIKCDSLPSTVRVLLKLCLDCGLADTLLKLSLKVLELKVAARETFG